MDGEEPVMILNPNQYTIEDEENQQQPEQKLDFNIGYDIDKIEEEAEKTKADKFVDFQTQ